MPGSAHKRLCVVPKVGSAHIFQQVSLCAELVANCAHKGWTRGYAAVMGTVRILRVYEQPDAGEYRVLVDRLWPRGVKKDQIDLWLKEIAPSAAVRHAFDHVPERFDTFVRDYTAELAHNEAVAQLRAVMAAHQQVVLLYGAKDERHNQAAVLLKFITRR